MTRILATALVLAGFATGVAAADPLPAPAEAITAAPLPAPGGGAAIDPARLEAFVDGVMAARLSEDEIAGATVAIVDRTRVLLRKGYGTAREGEPTDPQRHLFRIGSVSKTFTYVAAMQLVAEGRLDLGAEVDPLLPERLRIGDDGFAPLRVIDLFQHTGGFEDSAIPHLFAADAARSLPLEDYLAAWKPKRVRAPGEAAVYSNYSVALLGYLAARIDGRPFEAMIEARLLQPLGMDQATFREPRGDGDPRDARAALAGDFAQGFAREAGRFVPRSFEFIGQAGPAGAMSASAGAMVPWMQMLLNGGRLGDAVILDAESFALMASDSFRNAPGAGGIAHGFFTSAYGGRRSLEHGGATLLFHSNMVVVPEAGIGVFISTNSGGGQDLAAAFPRLVIEAMVPEIAAAAAPEPQSPDDAAKAEAAALAGSWLSERRNVSSFEGFIMRIAGGVTLSATGDGAILVSSGTTTRRFVRLRDDLWGEAGGHRRIAVLRDEAGRIAAISRSPGVTIDRKVSGPGGPLGFNLLLMMTVIGGVLALIGAWLRFWFARPVPQTQGGRWAGRAGLLTALIWVAGLAVTIAAIVLTAADPAGWVYGDNQGLAQVIHIGLHGAALVTLIAIVLTPFLFLDRGVSWWRRVTHMLFVVIAAGLVAVLIEWGALLTPLTIAG